MEKKNLEQLYLDGLKGFQETPDERVWRNIEASLEKKKRKGIVPIWWQLGGVAALLAILFYVINPFANNVTIDGPTITDVEQKEDSKTEGEQSGFQEKINSSSSLRTKKKTILILQTLTNSNLPTLRLLKTKMTVMKSPFLK